MSRNSHARATLQMLKEADEEGIDVDSDRVEELESKVESGTNTTEERTCSNCGRLVSDVSKDGAGIDQLLPCGCKVATDGHGNRYNVDGEHVDDADELERRATIERHEDDGYLITDGGVHQTSRTLHASEKALLYTLYETGSGVYSEVAERFANLTGFSHDTASGRLSSLSKEGLVEQRANIRNPSSSIWKITARGKHYVETELLTGDGGCDLNGRWGSGDGDD